MILLLVNQKEVEFFNMAPLFNIFPPKVDINHQSLPQFTFEFFTIKWKRMIEIKIDEKRFEYDN